MKKILSLMLIFICFTALVSCGGKNGLGEYTIYLPESAEVWERKAAYELADMISDTHGIRPEIVLSEDKRTEKEIICGYLCLGEELSSEFDYDGMGYNGYAVETKGDSYILTASTETGLKAALEYFVTNAVGEDQTLESEFSFFCGHSTSTEGDSSKHLNVNIPYAGGVDPYMVHESAPAGYRYGPSIIINDDQSIDLWLAGGGSGAEQWDWILYMHSKDGKEWSEEKCVLQPTPNSLDHYSCCDPGVIYLNGYYYLAYTSTLNANQCDNNLFVARSEKPDGPFEKWNGNGWGGNEPKPIVYFGEDQSLWGIGEASFVELDGTLYIYYTENGSKGHITRVATADASDENWPLTMEDKGIAIPHHTHDAIDVKYVDEHGKFLAVAADQRLSEDSYLIFYESNDGISFEAVDACKKNVRYFCHNPGISGSPNGHITSDMKKTYVGYAYGEGWGMWNTRLQEIEISLSDSTDFSEINGSNIATPIQRDTSDLNLKQTVGINGHTKCVMRVPLKQQYAILSLAKCDVTRTQWDSLSNYSKQVKLYGYDEKIASQVESGKLTMRLHSVGETMITVEYEGHLTYVYLIVYDDEADSNEIVSVESVAYDNLDVNISEGKQYQLKSIVTYGDGRWEMVWSQKEHGISYEYDSDAVHIDENSYLTVKKPGSHTITLKAGNVTGTLTVNVAPRDMELLDFSESDDISMISYLNNCRAEVEDKALKLTCTADEDPYIRIDYKGGFLSCEDFESVTVKYKIPKKNGLKTYSCQIFFCCGENAALTEETSQRHNLTKNGEYSELELELEDAPYWKGGLEEIRIDFFDLCEKGDVIYIESIELNKK